MIDILDTCKICNEKILDNKHFWIKHGIKLAIYIETYFSKFDLYDNSKIKFTNLESYSLNDFNSRLNMKAWINSISIDKLRNWCLESLKKRKEIKGLNFVPCEVELRTLMLPPISIMEKAFEKDGGYNNFIEKELKCSPRFKKLDYTIEKNTTKFQILVDSREAKPIKFPSHEVVVYALPYGDYHSDSSKHIFFERKSLPDAVATLTSGSDRFKKEINRALKDSAYIIVMLECPIHDLMNFNKMKFYERHLKVSSDFVLHNMRSLLQTYSNLQFFFCENRNDMEKTIPNIINLGDKVKTTDLFYARNINLI